MKLNYHCVKIQKEQKRKRRKRYESKFIDNYSHRRVRIALCKDEVIYGCVISVIIPFRMDIRIKKDEIE